MSRSFSVPSEIPSSIFRAYDIRGVVEEVLTPDLVYAIALAIGCESQQRGRDTVIVGRDGRLSSPVLSKSLSAGLRASGCDIIDIGLVPTPALYFATHQLSTNSGVMLTGSHNPAQYNGLKIVLAGTTLIEKEVRGLYDSLVAGDLPQAGKGSYTTYDLLPQYLERIVADVHLARPLKVVVDCGSGAAGVIAPQLLAAIGCEVIPLFCDVDGRFPYHHPDPSQEENLQQLIDVVLSSGADIGLAFDGDADRLGVVTNAGEIIWPDRQLMLFAQDVLSRHPKAPIVFDVKCSQHLARVIEAAGGVPVLWKTGHSLIKAKMHALASPLAGEMSGHIFFKERWYGFDDAIYVAARLLEILAATSATAESLFARLPNSVCTPELKIPISDATKFSFMERLVQHAQSVDAAINTIDGLRLTFHDGWGLVRASNTTPALTLRFEADTPAALQRIQTFFADLIRQIDPGLGDFG